MTIVITGEAAAGALTAAAIVAALAASALFRALFLAAFVAGTGVVYADGGFDGFPAVFLMTADAVAAHPEFRTGLLVGALFAAVLTIAGLGRRSRPAAGAM